MIVNHGRLKMLRIAGAGLIGLALLAGCAREERITAEDIRAYQLTEDDITVFIDNYSGINKLMREIEKGMDPEQLLKDPYTAFASVQLTPSQKKAVKELGFRSSAEFLKIVGAITATYSACAMEKAIEEMRAEMAKDLPGMPPETKAQMEKELAEMEAKAKPEYAVSDHNMELVRKHYDHLTLAITSGLE